MPSRIELCSTSDVDVGGALRVEKDDLILAVFNVDGEFLAVEDVCTHDGGGLSGGTVEGDQVICPRHGARIDIRTGKALSLPAVFPVETFPVRVDDGIVKVEV